MILDIARHKLYEALLSLMGLALAMVVMGLVTPSEAVPYDVAPLGALLIGFEASHPIVSAIVCFVLTLYLAFKATRTTVRTHLYGANSFAVMTLSPLVVMGLATAGGMLRAVVVAWLVVETLRRIFYAFGSEERKHAIFTAMLAIGTLPLMDSALSVALLTLPLVLVALRVGGREAIVGVAGALLPIFAYAYVVWCSGGEFIESFLYPFRAMGEPSGMEVVDYLCMPRVVMLATLGVMTLAGGYAYLRNRLALSLVARQAWRFIITTLVVGIAVVVLLPSATSATYVALGIVVAMVLPMLILRLSTMLSVALYILLLSGGVASMLAS